MKTAAEVAGWLIAAFLAVLVITHPRGFSQDVTAVGTQTNAIGTTLTGAGQPERQ
jgi:Flp pilus assembly pilin Flp